MNRIDSGIIAPETLTVEKTGHHEWTVKSADGRFQATYHGTKTPETGAYSHLGAYNSGWAEGYAAAAADLRDMGLLNTGIKEHN